MPSSAPSSVRPGAGYRHEALLFAGTDELLERAVPFVRDGVAAGEAVMVSLVDGQWDPLRRALGRTAEHVRRVDMSVLGRNPARLMPAWHAFMAEHASSGRPMRGLGELIYPGRRAAEVAECQLHEALLNHAVPPATPLWLLCPYDVTVVPDAVVAEARRSHPVVAEPGGADVGSVFGGADHLGDLWRTPLPPSRPDARTTAFARGGLGAVRHVVRDGAAAAGLSRDRTEDLVLAVTELAANSLDHGGGRGVLRLWTEPGAFLCEVADTGRLDDVLVGRVAPVTGQIRGRGVWMVNQLCDLVQIRATTDGTVVRIHSWT